MGTSIFQFHGVSVYNVMARLSSWVVQINSHWIYIFILKLYFRNILILMLQLYKVTPYVVILLNNDKHVLCPRYHLW